MDFNKMSKTLCDSMSIGYSKYAFLFGFSSGSKSDAFAVPPEIAKGMIEGLTQKLVEYETQFGKIDISANKIGIQSPIQRN